MNCPHCNASIPDTDIARHLASKGGRKSRRKLTAKQARAMVEAREAKKPRGRERARAAKVAETKAAKTKTTASRIRLRPPNGPGG